LIPNEELEETRDREWIRDCQVEKEVLRVDVRERAKGKSRKAETQER
jgi:hypothetical protein